MGMTFSECPYIIIYTVFGCVIYTLYTSWLKKLEAWSIIGHGILYVKNARSSNRPAGRVLTKTTPHR